MENEEIRLLEKQVELLQSEVYDLEYAMDQATTNYDEASNLLSSLFYKLQKLKGVSK